MTIPKFKEMYPQFAHLEGNALWNKMEDVLFLTQKQLPEEVKDWKGNILKEGDEFAIVQVIQRQLFSSYGFLILDLEDTSKSTMVKSEEPAKPDEAIWEPSQFYRVQCMYKSKRLVYNINCNGFSITTSLSMLNFDLYGQDQFIIVIKGVSDKREDYEKQNTAHNRLKGE